MSVSAPSRSSSKQNLNQGWDIGWTTTVHLQSQRHQHFFRSREYNRLSLRLLQSCASGRFLGAKEHINVGYAEIQRHLSNRMRRGITIRTKGNVDFVRRQPAVSGMSRGMRAHWLSRSKLSLLDKWGGRILVSTEVPRMGLQSCPVYNGGDTAEPTMAAAIGAHPDFARSARLAGISFLAPPYPCSITGRHLPLTIRCAWNMPSPGSTINEASPGRASSEGRDPCSKQALVHVSMGTDRWSYGDRRFCGCPCLRHSPFGGKKIARVVHSPTNDQATAHSSEVFIICPQKGASANPVWITPGTQIASCPCHPSHARPLRRPPSSTQ